MRELVADRYYGDIAKGYDAKREGKPGWLKEQSAIYDMVITGPVLDVPVGTGRYIPIYKLKDLEFTGLDISSDMLNQARLKCDDAHLVEGSIFDLPFKDGSFETAVCSRLLNWLTADQVCQALSSLRRVSKRIVFSIRTGPKEHLADRGNLTHSHDTLYKAIDGLFIEKRRKISIYEYGVFEMFKVRPIAWNDVRRQFRYHDDKDEAIDRLTSVWTGRYNLCSVTPAEGTVTCEYWRHDRIGRMLDEMSSTPRIDGSLNRIKTDDPPRFKKGAATVVRTQGREFLIDGRRRSNQWCKKPGRYPVFVVSVEPT